jgi:L-ribulose-5-phosphate 3-epimerase
VQLSAITDEISQDLELALRVCESLGIETVELRTIDGVQLVEHDAATVRRIGSAIRGGGFGCAVIDTPFLKVAPVGEAVSEGEWTTFRRGLEFAAELGATTVRVFSGARPDPLPATARWTADVLARAGDLAADAAVRVALEIEWECAVATRDEAADVLAAMPAGGLGIVWDPSNEGRFTGAATPPDGDAAVRERIVHVHVKDVDGSGEWTQVGSGLVDWRGELRRLAADGYDGLLSLETHYSLPDGGRAAATRESAAALRELAADEGIALSPPAPAPGTRPPGGETPWA